MAERFDQRHLIALNTMGLINELPVELGPMPVSEFGPEIAEDLHRWGVVDPATGGLSAIAEEQLAGVVDYEWALSGIVLLYSERRSVEVELPQEFLQAGLQYSLRDVPRVTFLIGYRDDTLTTLTLARGHLAVAIDEVHHTAATHPEYHAAAAVVAALLDPAGNWEPYPMDEIAVPAPAARAAARLRTDDLDDVLDTTSDVLNDVNMAAPTTRTLHELLQADNVATAQIVLTRRTAVGKRRRKDSALGVMFFDSPAKSGTVVSYPTRAIDGKPWITYEPATPAALARGITELHAALDTATASDLHRL